MRTRGELPVPNLRHSSTRPTHGPVLSGAFRSSHARPGRSVPDQGWGWGWRSADEYEPASGPSGPSADSVQASWLSASGAARGEAAAMSSSMSRRRCRRDPTASAVAAPLVAAATVRPSNHPLLLTFAAWSEMPRTPRTSTVSQWYAECAAPGDVPAGSAQREVADVVEQGGGRLPARPCRRPARPSRVFGVPHRLRPVQTGAPEPAPPPEPAAAAGRFLTLRDGNSDAGVPRRP